ncbi:MAG: alpha/beta hydrolase [Bacteroidota bacterium]
MTLQDWKNKGTYFTYKSHQIFYVEEGEGETLLLVHGFPTASWDWAKMWNTLTQKYRVLTLDMIGFGFSAKPRKYNYNIFDQADLIEALLRQRQIKRVQIIAHDYGDTVTQELLARFHERKQSQEEGTTISSVCFLNGGLFPETHRPLLVQKLLMSPLGHTVAQFFNRKKLKKNFQKIFGPDTQPSEQELDDFWTLISNNGGKHVFHLLIRYMQERKENRSRWVGAIQNMDVPIRLIDGLHDPISGANMVKRYKEIIPNPDVVELEGIGHYPLTEAPELVLKYYLGWDRNLLQ